MVVILNTYLAQTKSIPTELKLLSTIRLLSALKRDVEALITLVGLPCGPSELKDGLDCRVKVVHVTILRCWNNGIKKWISGRKYAKSLEFAPFRGFERGPTNRRQGQPSHHELGRPASIFFKLRLTQLIVTGVHENQMNSTSHFAVIPAFWWIVGVVGSIRQVHA